MDIVSYCNENRRKIRGIGRRAVTGRDLVQEKHMEVNIGPCRKRDKMRTPADSLAAVAVLVMLIFGAAVGRTSAKDIKKSPDVPALFIFGDSLSDTGTNNYIPGYSYPPLPQANIVPYGETFFHFPTGRWSNGRLMFDFIAQYLKLPFPEPFLKPGAKFIKGACFSSGGSGILDSTSASEHVIPLSKQLHQFEQVMAELKKDLGNDTADCIISKSLYAFTEGSNDISAYLQNATLQQTVTPEEFIRMVITKFETDILTLIGLGARKIVLDSQGPSGCSPIILATVNSTGACVERVNEISAGFNSALLELVTGVNAKMNTTVIILSNRYNVSLDLILNGASKGFTEGLRGCCGDGLFNGVAYSCGRGNYSLCSDVSKHVHWDFTHPTERVNRIVAHNMWNGNISYIHPINVHELSSI